MAQIDIFGNIEYVRKRENKSEYIIREKADTPDNRYIFNDVLSIKPNYTTVYAELISGNRNTQNVNSMLNLSDNVQSGIISSKANKRLYDCIDWLLHIAKEKLLYNNKFKSSFLFKLNMITLTLPTKQLHADNYVKNRMLNGFLTILRQRYELCNYIWKAEKTQSGNIHFHILTDIYIHYAEINKIWNKILSTNGYIEVYRQKMKEYFKNGFRLFDKVADRRSREIQLKAYKNNIRTNFSNPTGTTDIHSLRKIKNIKAYVSKYLAKNIDVNKAVGIEVERYCKENNVENVNSIEYEMLLDKVMNKLKVSGNIWFISRSLSKLKGAATDITDAVRKELDRIDSLWNDKILKFDYCTIIKIPVSEFIKKGLFQLKKIFDLHIDNIRKITGTTNTGTALPLY